MKIFLYVVLVLIILAGIAYKVLDYMAIKEQEEKFEQMANTAVKEPPRSFPETLRMSDEKFWSLISQSKSKYPEDFYGQIQFLTSELSLLSDEEIMGFECTFREKVIELWDYKVKGLYQIIEGEHVSKNDLIYFRCYLISLGKDAFETALKKTDQLSIHIDRTHWSGKEMITVADFAYQKKYPQFEESKLPSKVGRAVDYESGAYKMTGRYIPLAAYETIFPNLTSTYWNQLEALMNKIHSAF